MKRFIVLAILFFCSSTSFAVQPTMQESCNNYGGTYKRNVTITNYFVITSGEILGVYFDNSNNSPHVTPFANSAAGYIYDMVKVAWMTGAKVKVCLSYNEDYLVGLEWEE